MGNARLQHGEDRGEISSGRYVNSLEIGKSVVGCGLVLQGDGGLWTRRTSVEQLGTRPYEMG